MYENPQVYPKREMREAQKKLGGGKADLAVGFRDGG